MTDKKKTTEDLLKEKSLWEVYCLAWKLPIPWGILLPSVLLSVGMFIFSLASLDIPNSLIFIARQVIDVGITFTTTILGFLIAGFTVFATLTNPHLLVKMARLQEESSKLSWLKRTYAIFMHVFAHYASYIFAAVLIKLLTIPGGAASYIVANWLCNSLNAKAWIAAIGLSIMSGWLVYLTLLLGRFIFNIYHVCILTIAAANEEL